MKHSLISCFEHKRFNLHYCLCRFFQLSRNDAVIYFLKFYICLVDVQKKYLYFAPRSYLITI